MPSLRTPSTKKLYQEHVKNNPSPGECALCAKSALKSFGHWKVTDNAFPYDLIADKHHMIVPIRHIAENDLSAAELEEFKTIKESFVNSEYDYIIEATPKNKSIPAHFHLHLIIGKS